MKYIMIIAAVVAISGCGAADRLSSSLTGKASKVCIDGVEYLQFTSGATVAYSRDGKVKLCGS